MAKKKVEYQREGVVPISSITQDENAVNIEAYIFGSEFNQLTKKDVTKGYKIAGTGTIEPDGTIGQIGGIKYKIIGAEADKADYFLAPAGENYKDAKKYAKENNYKVKIIEVSTIEEAIKKLEGLEWE